MVSSLTAESTPIQSHAPALTFPDIFTLTKVDEKESLGRNETTRIRFTIISRQLCGVSLTSSSTVETPKAFKHQRQRRGICSQAWVYPFSSMVRLDLPIVLNWNRGERKSLKDLE
eukprot:scaffold2361_cov203-Alexandrium_tamarense.AAC.9